jgi:two-component system response regulator DctR
LIQAVIKACERRLEMSFQQAETDELRRRAKLLTPRERTIVSMVIRGMMNKQIADHLQLAVVTVKLHRKNAMTKLKARSSAELARIALLIGL